MIIPVRIIAIRKMESVYLGHRVIPEDSEEGSPWRKGS